MSCKGCLYEFLDKTDPICATCVRAKEYRTDNYIRRKQDEKEDVCDFCNSCGMLWCGNKCTCKDE